MAARAYVIGYDIADPRRLGRIHREMLRHACPIEYSVFLLVGTEQAREACLAQMQQLMDRREDDVRCYPLPARGLQLRIGRATLPAGIQWTGLPAPLA
ncbi:MAG: CRISPR-associated endonuclease Cas2 [Caenispirillum sp.]|nr:CRISPR-associated endonuclease Cas2 [Caenispirillum sp.]